MDAVDDERIVARAARELVLAALAVQRVVAGAAIQRVVARAAQQNVVAGAAVRGVVARPTVEQIVTRAAGQRVVARVAIDLVVAGIAREQVVTTSTVDDVIAATAADRVVVVGAGQHVVAVGTLLRAADGPVIRLAASRRAHRRELDRSHAAEIDRDRRRRSRCRLNRLPDIRAGNGRQRRARVAIAEMDPAREAGQCAGIDQRARHQHRARSNGSPHPAGGGNDGHGAAFGRVRDRGRLRAVAGGRAVGGRGLGGARHAQRMNDEQADEGGGQWPGHHQGVVPTPWCRLACGRGRCVAAGEQARKGRSRSWRSRKRSGRHGAMPSTAGFRAGSPSRMTMDGPTPDRCHPGRQRSLG